MATKSEGLSRAAAESTARAAMRTPSSMVGARSAATRAAAALRRVMSRRGPRSPSRTRRRAAAFSSGLPPRTASLGGAGEGERVGAAVAGDGEGGAGAEAAESGGEEGRQLRPGDAEEVVGGAG